MEPDFEEYEEYITEIENYRKSSLDDILNKYTNNGSQDYIIDIKTLKVIGSKGTDFTVPSFGTLTSYFCEPAHKMLEELRSRKEEVKATSQKKPLEWGKDSGIGTDTSGTAESSQESFTSSDEDFDFSYRGHDSKVSGKDLGFSQKTSKRDFSFRGHDGKVSGKDLYISQKISKRDFSFRGHDGKVSGKDLCISQKISKREFSYRRHDSKVSEDLDSSPKVSICDLSIGKYNSKEKDLDSSQKKSKWGNTKPNLIPVRRSKRDTSNLRNIPVDDLSIKPFIKIIK